MVEGLLTPFHASGIHRCTFRRSSTTTTAGVILQSLIVAEDKGSLVRGTTVTKGERSTLLFSALGYGVRH